MQQPIVFIGTGGTQPRILQLSIDQNKISISTNGEVASGGSIYAVALQENNSHFASADKSGKITINIQQDGFPVAAWFLHLSTSLPAVTGLAFLGEQRLVSAGSDRKLKIYDLQVKDKVPDEIATPQIVFALRSITDRWIGGLCRDQSGDHLYVWDVVTRQIVYVGPVFKIASNYFAATIDLDPVKGFLAHGDRFGGIHLYKLATSFTHSIIRTNHGNLCGIAFCGEYLYSAGEQDSTVAQWSLSETASPKQTLQMVAPVLWLARLSSSIIIAGLSTNMVVAIDCSGALRVVDEKQLPEIRCMAGIPAGHLMRLEVDNWFETGRELLKNIKQLFEDGKKEEAYRALTEMENKGYKLEALDALIIAERAQGNLLSELEALLLMTALPLESTVIITYVLRLAQLFEQVYEPELACATYRRLIDMGGDAAFAEERIRLLEPMCIYEGEGIVSLHGFEHPEAPLVEIRKAEILGRQFMEPTAIKEKQGKTVPSDFSIEKILQSATSTPLRSIKEQTITEVVWKKNGVRKKGNILRCVPTEGGPRNIELWVELEKRIDDLILITSTMFIPSASQEKNTATAENIQRLSKDPTVEAWTAAAEMEIVKSISATSSNDDDMFK